MKNKDTQLIWENYSTVQIDESVHDRMTVGELTERLQVDFQDHEEVQFIIDGQRAKIESIEHEGLGEGPVVIYLSLPPRSARRTTQVDV